MELSALNAQSYIYAYVQQLYQQNLDLLQNIFKYEKEAVLKEGRIAKLEEQLRICLQQQQNALEVSEGDAHDDVVQYYARVNEELYEQLSSVSLEVVSVRDAYAVSQDSLCAMYRYVDELELSNASLRRYATLMFEHKAYLQTQCTYLQPQIYDAERAIQTARLEITAFSKHMSAFSQFDSAILRLVNGINAAETRFAVQTQQLEKLYQDNAGQRVALGSCEVAAGNILEQLSYCAADMQNAKSALSDAHDGMCSLVDEAYTAIDMLFRHLYAEQRKSQQLQSDLERERRDAIERCCAVEAYCQEQLNCVNYRFYGEGQRIYYVCSHAQHDFQQCNNELNSLRNYMRDNVFLAQKSFDYLKEAIAAQASGRIREIGVNYTNNTQIQALAAENEQGKAKIRNFEAKINEQRYLIAYLEANFKQCESDYHSELNRREQEFEQSYYKCEVLSKQFEVLQQEKAQLETHNQVMRSSCDIQKQMSKNYVAKAEQDKVQIDRLQAELEIMKRVISAAEKTRVYSGKYQSSYQVGILASADSHIYGPNAENMEFKYVQTDDQEDVQHGKQQQLANEASSAEIEQLRLQMAQFSGLLYQIDAINPNDLYSAVYLNKLFARFALSYLYDRGRIEEHERNQLLQNYLKQQNADATEALTGDEIIRNPQNDVEYMSSKLLIQEHSIATLQNQLLQHDDNYEAMRVKFMQLIQEKLPSNMKLQLIKYIYDNMEQQLKNKIDGLKDQLFKTTVELEMECDYNVVLQEKILKQIQQERISSDGEKIRDFEKAKIIQHYKFLNSADRKYSQQYKK